MAELDPYIILRGKPYAGPTQDELDAKQNMNALRNMLGAGQSIDSPEVVNAMMARDPEMGLKLMTNANTMRNDAASLQAKQQEARLAELDALVPVGAAIVKAGDQQAWDEFRMHLGQKYPEALTGYPANVQKGGEFLQSYIDARRSLKGAGNAAPFRYGAPVATDQGFMVLGENGQPTLLKDASGRPFMPPPKGADGGSEPTYGMSSEYAVDANGNTVLVQRGSRGDVKITRLPEGLRPALPTRSVDLGTTVQTVESAGGTPIATTPKDVQGEAYAKKLGDLDAAQVAAAGSNVDFGTVALQQIDGVLKDPNLSKGTGIMSMVNFIPGTGSYAFQAKVDQVTGAAFLQGIQKMQGTGAITEIEGAKATAALNRAMTGLSEPEFRKAMEEYRAIVAKGLEKARALEGRRTGVSAEQPAAATPGATNPADPLGLLGGK